MINPGTAGLATLMKTRIKKSRKKTKILKIFTCYGCSYSPLS